MSNRFCQWPPPSLKQAGPAGSVLLHINTDSDMNCHHKDIAIENMFTLVVYAWYYAIIIRLFLGTMW